MKRISVFLVSLMLASNCFAADVTIVIPDNVLSRVLNGVCYVNGYQDTVIINEEEVPNPETKALFAKRMVRRYLKECVKAYEATLAANTARNNAITSVESDINLQ